MRFRLPLLFLVLGLLLSLPLRAAVEPRALEEVRILADSGAVSLAIHVLEQRQPPVKQNLADWMTWERERFAIYQAGEDWPGLLQRVETLPPDLPPAFQRWAMSRKAEALIKLQRAGAALPVLQELIWTQPLDAPDATQQLQALRHLVMRAYLVAGETEDAHLAAVRYFQEYGEAGPADRLLRARILLGAGHADEAVDLLAGQATEPRAGALYLLAQLRSNRRTPRKVLQAGLRQLRGKDVAPDIQVLLWAVVAEAAQRSADRATATNALEHVLAGRETHPLPEGLFRYDADSLWNAYIDFASYLGNQARLLIGQDKPWFEAAAKVGKKQPVRARAFYALLVMRGETPASRERAAQNLVKLLLGRKRGGTLLRVLFLQSRNFDDRSRIPVVVRHALVDVALAESDLPLASELMATVTAPPPGADQFLWALRRARIFVLGGEVEQGVAALKAILQDYPEMSTEQQDRFLQVVFDLQTVKEHEDAIGLLRAIFARSQDRKQRRELLYWMAESRKAQEKYASAAYLYLQSAMLPGPDTMDPWAQTARYQAAEALARAGMVGDARKLFGQLLRATKDPGRRAVLQHELQKLWLLGPKPEAPLEFGPGVNADVNAGVNAADDTAAAATE